MAEFKSSITTTLGYAHLVYLGLLPAVATFSLLFLYGHPAPLLLFLGGTVAVGVYLAVIFSYTPFSTSLAWALLTLLDGPTWVLLALRSTGVTPFAFAIEGFLVDGTAIWISILLLALSSPVPSRQERIASIGFMLAALAVTVWLVWPYYQHVLAGRWLSIGFLAFGVVESILVRYFILKRDKVVRSNNIVATYLVILLLIWIASLILGNVLHELSRR